MYSHVSDYFAQKWEEARFDTYPYPHLYIENIFPPDFYQKMLDLAPANEKLRTLNSLKRVGSGYPETRKIVALDSESLKVLDGEHHDFWLSVAAWTNSKEFYGPILKKFDSLIRLRFQRPIKLTAEALYVQDESTYSLGPHSDSESKVITLLFYLPRDDSMKNLGTSIYLPKDPAFTCVGGPHHKFDQFKLYKTMPFMPNCMFGFLKTNNSFHGVEPIKETVRRDLMLYDVKYKDLK